MWRTHDKRSLHTLVLLLSSKVKRPLLEDEMIRQTGRYERSTVAGDEVKPLERDIRSPEAFWRKVRKRCLTLRK